MTSPSPGMKSPASTSTTSPLRRQAGTTSCRRSRRPAVLEPSFLAGDRRAGLAQRFGLGLAAPLGHRLGEVGEEHREPQPERDGEDEAGGRLAVAERAPGRTAPSSACCRPTTTNITGFFARSNARVELAQGRRLGLPGSG